MKKSDLQGTRQVFAFTLTQYFKNKSTIVTLVIMFLFSSIIMGIMAFSGDTVVSDAGIHPEFFPDDSEFTLSVAVINETDLPLSTADIEKKYYDSLLSVGIFAPDEPVEFDADTVRIRLYNTGRGYGLEYSLPEEGETSSYMLEDFEVALRSAINAAYHRANGATEEQIALLHSDVSTYYMTESEYTDMMAPDSTPDVLDPEDGGLFALSYAYSIVVLMLVMFSSSYIIRSVVEEKDSKLVELLMVSVKPLALILGKILATMVFVVAALAALLAGMGISATLIGFFSEAPSAVPDALSGLGIDLSMTLRVILIIPALLVSLILAFLTFSLIGGVLGACCSKLEDTGAAVSAISIIALVAYMLTTVGSVSGSYGFAVFCSVCPFVSVFFAPVSYATGIIGFGLLALSWLLQAVVVVLLALFCARVYGALIIHRGNRIKLGALISMARKGGSN